MARLSAFSDEISPDPVEQLDVLEECGLRYLDLRSAWATGVLDLTGAQIERLASMTRRRGIGVAAIGSPIGKSSIERPAAFEMNRLRQACEIAETLGSDFIRVFSFYPPEGETIERQGGEVLARIRQWVEWTRTHHPRLTLVHENESRIYGEPPSRCLELLEALESQGFRHCYDPANFVTAGQVGVFDSCWKPLRDYVGYFHLKDRKRGGHAMPVGEGDGEMERTLRDAVDRGYDGFLAIEPHLKGIEQYSGQSGPDLFRKAVTAARIVCDRAGLPLT